MKEIHSKQQTLEEAAEKHRKHWVNNTDLTISDMFIAGANWQAERMYSEEDMKLAWEDGRDGTSVVGNFPFTKTVFTHRSFNEWFEQFKKK